jgi:hypothetical protein
MSAPRRRHERRLSQEAAARVDAYMSRVRDALRVNAPGECEETMEGLRAYLFDELAGGAGTPAEAARVLAELGPPEALAAQCAEAARDEPTASERREKRSLFSGRVLGIPYDLRPPTAERIASRWWDPLNPRIFVPRLFGAGWTVNFASVAVRLGLVRPDDEDVPFGLVPGRWLTAALALPLAVAAALAALIAVVQPALPASVPVSLSISGDAEGFASKGMALALPVCMTLLGLVLASWTWAKRRPPLPRVAAGALATMLATISIAAYGQQAAAAYGHAGIAILITGMIASLALPFALLVILSRVGRTAEQRRDLGRTGKEGGV